MKRYIPSLANRNPPVARPIYPGQLGIQFDLREIGQTKFTHLSLTLLGPRVMHGFGQTLLGARQKTAPRKSSETLGLQGD
jgi:hypothetical protein